tara:strand:+ start:312 stop:704 length:393 start_codon:yes stop_codon:yes gene_type:complete
MCHIGVVRKELYLVDSELLKYALDFGTMGVMAYIFFWLYLRQQKKIDEMITNQKDEEEKIRSRFTAVIEKYDNEKESLTKERLDSLVKLKCEVANLKEINEKQDKQLLTTIEEIKLLRTEIQILNRKESS